MKRIGIVTDSNSGITQAEAEKLGIKVVPMPFTIDGVEYYEDVTMNREHFFERLNAGADVKTSQPSLDYLLRLWDEMLEEYEILLYIPMSIGLSSSAATAKFLAENYNGRVCVVDNRRISCTQKMSVLEALELRRLGYSVLQIREILERTKQNASIYIAVDTVEHLKRGGRITPAGAAVSSVLHIKLILQIQGDKLDAYAKGRGDRMVHEKLLSAVEHDMETRFHGQEVAIKGAYTCSEKKALLWKQEMQERFPNHIISLDRLALSIGCHVGEGAIAIACMETLQEAPHVQYEIGGTIAS